MRVNERICLIIDDCILIASHTSSYTFIGGKVDDMNKKFGETCLRELEEEMGIRIISKIPKLISFFVSNNTIHALFILNVSKSDIEFTKASNVWEINAFTLIPVNDKSNPEDVAKWLIENIYTNNVCTTYLTLTNEKISTLEKLPPKLSQDKIIQYDDNTYYIKLVNQPKLSQQETEYLRYINLKINGFEDTINYFDGNKLCSIKYVKYRKYMYLQISTKSIIQIDHYSYNIDVKCSELETIDDLKKNLDGKYELSDDVVKSLKSIVSTIYSKLDEFGLKNVGNASFYYLDMEKFLCHGFNFGMFDIDDFDYLEPIKQLEKYYSGSEPNFYSKILQKYDKLSHPIYLHDYDSELDEVILQYVKCIPNMSVMIIWSVANIDDITKSPIYGELEQNGDIHAIKELLVTRRQIQGIIYQVYYDKEIFKHYEVVRNKAMKCSVDNTRNKLYVIFYVAKNKSSISGTDAPFKVKLRKLLKQSSRNKIDLKDNLYLHISDTHAEAVDLAMLFCNMNSMKLIQYQRLDRLMNGNFWKSFTYLMTMKSLLYSLLHPIDHIRFMLFSSSVLFSLGLRNVNDIDLIIHYLPKSENTKSTAFFDIVHKYLENEKTKLPFVVDGASIKGRNGWAVGGTKEYLIDWFEKDWPNLFGAKSLDDILLNPKFHYYFFGMKFVSIDGDIKRRIQRSRPAGYADLLAVKYFVSDKLFIPKIPKGYWKNHVYYDYTPKEKSDLIKKVVYYMKIRYHKNITDNDVKKILLD